MPVNVVKTNRDEKLWSEAKSIVRKQYPKIDDSSDRFYAITMSIYKKMKGKNMKKSQVKAYIRNVGGRMVSVVSYTNRKQSKALLANKSINSEVNMNTDSILDKYPLLTKSRVEAPDLEKSMLDDYPLLQKARIKAHPRRMKSGKIVQVREHQDIRRDKSRATSKDLLKVSAGLQKQGVDTKDFSMTAKDGKVQVFAVVNGKHFEAGQIAETNYDNEISYKVLKQRIKTARIDEKEHQRYQTELQHKYDKSLKDFPLLQKAVVKQHPRRVKSGKVTMVRQHTTSVQKKQAEAEIKARGGVEQLNKYENNYLGYENDVMVELKRQFPKLTKTDIENFVHKKYEKTIQAEWNKEKSTPPAKVAENIGISDAKAKAKTDTQKNQPISKERYTQVAKTIHQQIGHQALFMMGAKNLSAGTTESGMPYLGFRIGRNSKNINYIKVKLDEGKDLYNIEYGRIRKFEYKVVTEDKGIFVDKLHESITRNTGLYTSLGKMGQKKSLDAYPLLQKAIQPDRDKTNEFQIGDDKMKTPQKPMLDSVKFPTLAKAHANLKKSMSFKIGGQKLKTAIDGKIATCKGELIVLEKEYPPVPINSDDAPDKVCAEGEEVPTTQKKVEIKYSDHWKVRTKKREIKELETYSRNVNVKITYNLDKYELSQFGL